jgi:hypothetical protein
MSDLFAIVVNEIHGALEYKVTTEEIQTSWLVGHSLLGILGFAEEHGRLPDGKDKTEKYEG